MSVRKSKKGEHWTAVCDFCSSALGSYHPNPGEASEEARQKGWYTINGQTSAPLRWTCGRCKVAHG